MQEEPAFNMKRYPNSQIRTHCNLTGAYVKFDREITALNWYDAKSQKIPNKL